MIKLNEKKEGDSEFVIKIQWDRYLVYGRTLHDTRTLAASLLMMPRDHWHNLTIEPSRGEEIENMYYTPIPNPTKGFAQALAREKAGQI